MSRFTQNEDGTITDKETGLTWTKETLAKDVTYDNALKVLGDGWRLPTIKELFSLVDHAREAPAIDVEVFPETESDWYWSSTPTAWNEAAVWVVDFGSGNVDYAHRNSHACVRAVRCALQGEQCCAISRIHTLSMRPYVFTAPKNGSL